MKLFLHAHATHPDWHMALALAAAQIEAQRTRPDHAQAPTLGWVYLTGAYATAAAAVLDELRQRWPGVAWVGAVGVGVAGNGVEYIDEPALSLMMGELPHDAFRVFSGVQPLAGFDAAAAQVHADAGTDALDELLVELADRTRTGYLFGGLASAGPSAPALQIAEGVFRGGLSGVAFNSDVALVSRVTQGCQPVGPVRQVTLAERNLIVTLDGEPALDCLLRDLKADSQEPRDALPQLRRTLVGLNAAEDAMLSRAGQFGVDTTVRHLLGFDPARRGIAIADDARAGMQVAFCSRDVDAARRDLVRICAEIREELEPEDLPRETALALQGTDAERSPHPARRIAGAVYVSCAGRGGPHFGGPSAELAIVRHALGDVPLTGFFAGGEIARHHLYGYTGVLTVFTT